jgi:ActR/RegA family two-component response regulator
MQRWRIRVEDDESFARTLKRSFERRCYRVLLAPSQEQVVELFRTESPKYAVVDLKLEGASGLAGVQLLHAHDEQTTIHQTSPTPTSTFPKPRVGSAFIAARSLESCSSSR